MPDSTLPIPPDRCFTWEEWQAGRAQRRRLGNLVAPAIIRRTESSSDERLKATYDGERGPPFAKPFDSAGEGDSTAQDAQQPVTPPTDSLRCRGHSA